MKYIVIVLIAFMFGCAEPDPNHLGMVEVLPKGEYVIWNYGSRHIVRCLRPDGKYYYLNDADFAKNGISGYDAHQYTEKTRILIK